MDQKEQKDEIMPRAMILIPTHRRPDGLDKALSRIGQLQTTAEVAVLVADNDPARQEGVDVVRRFAAAGYRFPIRSIVVPERGVAHVRNALIASALDDAETGFLALLDDDEWPEPEWLEKLLDMQRRTGAEAVGGAMSPVFQIAPPPWAEQLALYRQQQDDGLTDMLWGTCNVLLTRGCLERLSPPWFDLQFGLTGGEDVEFFTRLKAMVRHFRVGQRGAGLRRRAAMSDARWIARRSFRIGNTNALTQLRWRYNRLGRLAIFVKSMGRLLTAAAAALPNGKSEGRPVEALCLSCRSFGEVAALLGVRYREYGKRQR